MTPLRAAINYYNLKAAWLGDGGAPVEQSLANKRTSICLICPLNQPMPIWELLTAPAANQLRRQLSLKANMQLVVPGEDGLHTCKACLCKLDLKVWTPPEHIKATIDAETLEALHRDAPHCWILKEMDSTP